VDNLAAVVGDENALSELVDDLLEEAAVRKFVC